MDLKILRRNLDRPFPGIEPCLRFGNVDAAMNQRRSEAKNRCIRGIWSSEGMNVLIVASLFHAVDDS